MANCLTCPYYFKLGSQCRIHPPVPVTINQGNQLATYPSWPPVKDADWCGDHPDFAGGKSKTAGAALLTGIFASGKKNGES